MIRSPNPNLYSFSIAAIAAFTFSSLATASIIPVLDTGSPQRAGLNWAYHYTGTLQDDAFLDPAASFFTLYDLGNKDTFVTAIAPEGWRWTSQFSGITPANVKTSGFSNGINITFFYAGAATQARSTAAAIKGFQVVSTAGGPPALGWFAGDAGLPSGSAAGASLQVVGRVEVPAMGSNPGNSSDPTVDPPADPDPPTSLPEPATSLLLAGGLLILGISGRHKRSI